MRTRILTTTVIVILLVIGMTGVRHIDHLEDGIKLKEIELQDNSLRLELLDKKYIELNKELDKTGADKKKLEQDLQQLQEERLRLQEALQAKKAQKERDLAVKAQQAVVPTVAAATPSVSGCGDAKSCVYFHESGGRTDAINASSGACGLGQALPCNKLPCSLSDYACQDSFFTRYALTRYGSWENACAYWQKNHWW